MEWEKENDMPKSMVALITAAFAWIIGFASGAFFTKPQNIEMEKLVNNKNELINKVAKSNTENESLRKQIKRIEEQNAAMKEKLFDAYQQLNENKDEGGNK